MDTLSPAVFVNGELLRMYVERRVRVVVQVTRVDGVAIAGQSTDGQHLVVRGSPSSFPLSHFIEVMGAAEGNQSICVEICIDFREQFGVGSSDRGGAEIWDQIGLLLLFQRQGSCLCHALCWRCWHSKWHR